MPFPLRFALLIGALFTVGLTPSLRARVAFIPLGDLPGGNVFAQATAISGDGTTIVGRSSSTLSGANSYEAFRWTATEGMTGLGALIGATSSEATAVSIDGAVIVGNSPPSGSAGAQLGFRWTADSGMSSLGDLTGGLETSNALGVSADGSVIVGFGTNTDNKKEAFRWTATSGLVGLGFFGDGSIIGYQSRAYGISADGAVIVGSAATPLYRGAPLSGYDHAFRRTAFPGLVDLGYIQTATDSYAPYALDYCAYAASATGEVAVGYARLLDGESREAIRWTPATGAVSLGDLPGGYRYSEARAVSADGTTVVGLANRGDGGDGAFIWDPVNGMSSIREILTQAGLADGWSIDAATGVSADGTKIVGYGRKDNTIQAWLLDLSASDNIGVRQSIDFPPIADRDFGVSENTLVLSATASSGLPVSFLILAGPATVSGDNLQVTGLGTVTVQATQAGDATYAPVTAIRSFAILDRTFQTVAFPEIHDRAYTPLDNTLVLSATASSGLPVVFSIISGPATVSDNTLTILAPGTITVQAAQAGDATYAPATASRSFTATKTQQTIDFAFIADQGEIISRLGMNLKIPLVATASSGLPVSFSILSDPGFASVSGNTLTVWNPGYFTIQASQAGDAVYAPAIATRSFTVYYKTPQSIDFTAPATRTFDAANNIVTLSATASSGLPVSFVLLPGSGSGTIIGDSLHITGAGTFVLQAAQAGDTTYAPTSITRTFTVAKATQTIAFEALADQSISAPAFELSATASTGLPVSFSVAGPASLGADGKTLSLTGETGVVTVTATQPGDTNYLAAYATRSFSVVEGIPQSIAFASLPPRLVGSVFTLSATSGSGLPVAFSLVEGPATLGSDGQTVTVGSSAGVVFIRATQSGGTHDGVIYAPAPSVTRSFQVSSKPLAQTITFARPSALVYGAEPFPLAASASSGLPVVFQLVSSSPAGIATLEADILAIHGAGQVVVRATQPGDDTFKPADPVTRSLTINKAPLAVSFEPAERLVGQANPVFIPHYTGFVNGDTAADIDLAPRGVTKATRSSSAGAYPLTFTGGSDLNYRFVPGTAAFLTVEGFGGSYEALFVDDSGVSRGKLELLVPDNALTFSGTLNLASLPSFIPVRGNLVASDGSAAQASWSPAPSTGITGLSLGFELTGDSLDGELSFAGASPSLLSIADGSRVFVQRLVSGKKQPAPWAGLHTLVLRDPAPLDDADTRSLPLGAGHASVSVSSSGTMTFTGKLADGVPLTGTALPAFLPPDSDNSDGLFRVFLRPYSKRLHSFLSGQLALVPHPDQTRFPDRFLVPESSGSLVWSKSALPSSTKPSALDSSYRSGFAAQLAAALDPWLPPAKATKTSVAFSLPERLSLLSPGSGTDALLQLDFLGDSLTDAEVLSLPAALTLRANGSFSPPSPNPRSFQLSVSPATGSLSGSFLLRDQVNPPPANPVTRKVTLSGTLRQGPSGSSDTLGHAHLLFDPVPGDSGPNSDAKISSELILSGP